MCPYHTIISDIILETDIISLSVSNWIV